MLAGGSVTLRAGSSVAAFALVAGGAVLLLGDAALRGAWSVFAVAAGPAFLVIWATWMLLVRPSIRIQSDRAVVVNVGRITELPWVRIVDIRRRLQLVFDLEDGRRVEAWGSPFLKRPFLGRRPTGSTSRGPQTPEDPSLAELRGAWMSGSGDMSIAPVVRRADTGALLVGALAVAACALSLTVARGVVAL
jgi:hypothetical protein